MSRILSHAHKLKRHRYKSTGGSIYFCTLSDCNFKVEIHLTLGKRTICWRCGREFNMNEYSIRLARPHCASCTKTKREDIAEAITTSIAAETNSSLKERLKQTVSSFAAHPDEGEL